ncbi:MAG: hypothetical protein ACOC1I_07705 [Spirochaetota bacterium]
MSAVAAAAAASTRPRSAFTPVDDALVQYTYQLHFEAEADGLTWLDFADGSNVIEIVPPTQVTTTTGSGTTIFGPENPIRSDEFWPNGGVPNETDINGFAFLGPPPQGLWIVNLNGGKDLTVDLGFGSLFDTDGNLYYFVPSLKVNVDGNERITSFELRFVYWDFDAEEYRDVLDEDAVPMLWTFMQSFEADGLELAPDEELRFENGIAAVPSEFYWPGTANERTLKAVHVAYDIGTPVNFVFEAGGP